ncbi:acyl carrier protein [Trichonephila clavipes]|nr:acyl carrier protein [Trichonephila clavipes]
MGPSVLRLRFALVKYINFHSQNIRNFSVSKKASRLLVPACTALQNDNFSKLQGNVLSKDKMLSNLVPVSRNYCSAKDGITEKVLHVCKTFDKIPADKARSQRSNTKVACSKYYIVIAKTSNLITLLRNPDTFPSRVILDPKIKYS